MDIPSEPLPVLAESLVEWVVAHSSEERLDRIEQVVLVSLVLLVKEHATLLADLVSTLVALGLKDVARLEQDLAEILVHLAEPGAKLLVVLSIVVESTSRVEDGVHAATVGEALEESAELGGSSAESGVARNALIR